MHLFQCEKAKPLWKACIHFCTTTLEAETPTKLPEAIIFTLVDKEELLPEDSRAFLRHAYNQFFHDFSNVDLKDTNFYWHLTFSSALKSFRLAALRYGMKDRILYSTRRYTNLVQEAPEEARKRFPSVVEVSNDGAFSLNPTFAAAVNAAEKEADDWMGANTGGGNPNRHRT
jgi:hypothetical protein|eukprot:7389305-Prymnesium_polylepis.1